MPVIDPIRDSANHSDSSGLARSLALSFSRVAAARRIPVLPHVLQRNLGFLARARHARGNDRNIRPSGRAVSLSCAGFNSVVPRKYLYTAKLSFSESVIFLISSPCPFPIPLPVQGEGKRAWRARVRAVATLMLCYRRLVDYAEAAQLIVNLLIRALAAEPDRLRWLLAARTKVQDHALDRSAALGQELADVREHRLDRMPAHFIEEFVAHSIRHE